MKVVAQSSGMEFLDYDVIEGGPQSVGSNWLECISVAPGNQTPGGPYGTLQEYADDHEGDFGQGRPDDPEDVFGGCSFHVVGKGKS